jgi:uncharacterized protein
VTDDRPQPHPGAMAGIPAGRWWTAGGLLAYAAAFGVLWAAGATAVESSADEYGAHPLWKLTLPVLVGLALARLVPPRLPRPVLDEVRPALRGRPVGWEAVALLACLAAFLLLLLVTGRPTDPEDPAALLYPVGKVVLFLVVPLIALRLTRPAGPAPSPGLAGIAVRLSPAWRWGGLLAVAAALCLGTFGPLAPPPPAAQDLPSVEVLVVGMIVTFLTASVLEEVFFRVWLQTRLELLLGPWAGVVMASLAFGVMHVVSHQALGPPVLTLAQVIAVQGVAGLLYGYLWMRYRNVWLVILLHTGVNSLALAPALLAG